MAVCRAVAPSLVLLIHEKYSDFDGVLTSAPPAGWGGGLSEGRRRAGKQSNEENFFARWIHIDGNMDVGYNMMAS